MRITIDIDTSNSSFWHECEDSTQIFIHEEVERILKNIIPKIEITDHGKANDINGNKVATFTVERDNEEY